MGRPYCFAQRFENGYVPEPNSGCWLWCGPVTRDGYGKTTDRYITKTAHRASWEINRGPIPKGLQVLHRCDQRSCVNPAHLFLGTNDENMADMVQKKRAARGERNIGAKLTAEQAQAILDAVNAGESAPEVAKRFGVGAETVRDIRSGEHWGDLVGIRRPRKPWLSAAQCSDLRARIASGEQIDLVARHFGVTRHTVYNITHGVTHAEA